MAAAVTGVVLGGGRGLWRELGGLSRLLGAAPSDYPGLEFVAVNHTGQLWPYDLAHWCTLHQELFRFWPVLRERHVDQAETGRTMRYSGKAKLHASRPDPEATCEIRLWPELHSGGSSGLFATRVALEIYERVVVVACPMDGAGHWYDPPWHGGIDYSKHEDGASWAARLDKPEYRPRLRATSGLTMELFGKPEREFFEWQPESMD